MGRRATTTPKTSEACLGDGTLAALLDRQLESESVGAVAAHIDACAGCRGLVAELARGCERSQGASESLSGPSAVRSSGPHASRVKRARRAKDLPAGQKFGRYVLLECIGAGAMGVVYKAYDPRLGRHLAVKVLRRRDGARLSRAERARAIREAQAIARVAHPNVIAIHDVGKQRGGVYLVMELVEGGTLRDWLEVGPSWREVVDAFLDAGEGLAAAHAAGLVHRDFKPDNVLVGHDGRVRVTDFGLARNTGAEPEPVDVWPDPVVTCVTRTGTLLGTPAYMSPEQIERGRVDERSDVFSYCVALYEGLYGERPFAGAELGELFEAVARGAVRPVPRGSRVPEWLRSLVLWGLRAAPRDRPATLRILLDAIRAHHGEGVARARRSPRVAGWARAS